MMVKIQTLIKKILGIFGIGLARKRDLQNLRMINNLVCRDRFRRLLLELSPVEIASIAPHLELSKAQICQDLFVIAKTSGMRNGYFVEFGAADGVHYSNTYLLETSLGWNGILAEPASCWHEKLDANRLCHIEHRCVWKDSGIRLDFIQTGTEGADLSTLAEFTERLGSESSGGIRYTVDTITLADLLESYSAPEYVDFLSIDTEGSEYEILAAHDFEKYKFRIICVEHNYTAMREKIFTLLRSKGYKRELDRVSLWDDWYVMQ